MNLRYVICSEIIDVRDGTHDSPKYIIDGGYPLITSKNINNNKIDFSNVNYISEEDYIKINQRSEVSNGDIIMPMIGTIGNPVIIDTDKKFAIKNVALFKLANNETILSKYFYYILKTQDIKRQLESNKRGGTQNFVSLKNIRDLKIPLIDILEQKKIVEILDKAQQLIDKRKKQIESLDELVKSKFIEMFGDPFRNPKGWTVKQLKEIILLANNGLARRGNDKDGNIVLRLVELQDGFIDYSSPNRIRLTESEEKRYLLQDGDFLFARVNGNPDNVGRCSAYEDIGESVYHNDHIIRVRLDKNIVNNDYVSAILNSPYGKLQMKDKLKTSAGQYTINQNGISEIKITIPPIELQNKFADFVKQVDKLKFEMEKSLKELEDNFNSLMQKAFKGELFN